MKRMALAAILALGASPAAAFGPLNGHWAGVAVTETGRCTHEYHLDLVIQDGLVNGTWEGIGIHYTIKAELTPRGQIDGVFAFGGDSVIKAKVRFGPEGAIGSWQGHDEARRRRSLLAPPETCYGDLELYRVPD